MTPFERVNAIHGIGSSPAVLVSCTSAVVPPEERARSLALAALTAWIERERLLVDDREDVGGINFSRMDAKAVVPLPHIVVSFFAHRPYKRKAGHYPQWNGFYLLLYRDVEEGWKLVQIRKNSSYAEFIPILAARSKAVQEINKRFNNDLEDHEEE